MPDSCPIPLYLFAKAPIPGAVKTRMQPQLTPAASAMLAQMMLEQSAGQVAKFWPGPRVLCVAPTLDHPSFDALADHAGFERRLQVDCDLGGRMLDALRAGIGQAGQAVVMGCDVPYIDADVLASTWQRMQLGSQVIGPAADGGFYLLGVDRLPRFGFDNIAWGGGQVFDRVVKQSVDDGIQFERLPVLRDIDRYQDLEWLATKDVRYRDFLGEGSKMDRACG